MLSEEKTNVKKPVKAKKKPLKGLVTNTVMLNLRKEPSFDSAVEMVLMNGTSFEIDPDYVNYEWYKVTLNDRTVGFVNKPYVETKE